MASCANFFGGSAPLRLKGGHHAAGGRNRPNLIVIRKWNPTWAAIRPGFPERFRSIEDARAFRRTFFDWYNRHHRHSGHATMTPHAFHHGRVNKLVVKRTTILALAHQHHPQRFVQGSLVRQ